MSPGEIPLPLVQLFCKKGKLVSLHPVVQLCPHQTPLAGPAGQNPPTQMVQLLSVKLSFKLDRPHYLWYGLYVLMDTALSADGPFCTTEDGISLIPLESKKLSDISVSCQKNLIIRG